MDNKKTDYYLALGTNIGDREKNLKDAIDYLNKSIDIISLSSIYKTLAEDMKPGASFFFNMVLKAESSITPYEMLELTQSIEIKMGREIKSKNGIYEDRIIDIDILLAGNQIINTEKLTLPHKKMLNRDFVLIPLHEIAPDLIHPINNKKISIFFSSLKDKGKTIKLI